MPDAVIRSDRRSLALIVEPDGRLIARAPRRMPQSQIDAFVFGKQGWILKKQAEARRYSAANRPFAAADGAPLAILGNSYVVELYGGAVVQARGGRLLLPSAGAQPALERWLRQLAAEVLTERAARFARQMGLGYSRVRLSNAAGRWGSCSGKDSISLNWRLVLCEPWVLDYVVVHELCHVRHKNHGPAFWAMVERYCENCAAARAWLRRNRAVLDQFRDA